jgi:hypothetical protein
METDDRNAPNDGRSAERRRQDDVLEQAAQQESWIGQLLRRLRLSKGRPKNGGKTS